MAPRLRRLARVAQGNFDIDMLADATRGAHDMWERAPVFGMLPEIMALHLRKLDPG